MPAHQLGLIIDGGTCEQERARQAAIMGPSVDVQQPVTLGEASARARFSRRGATVHGHANKVSAEGFKSLEEMRESFAGAGRVFDGDPRPPVAK